MGCERGVRMGGKCRIVFLNVQGLTVAKSVEIRILMVSIREMAEKER